MISRDTISSHVDIGRLMDAIEEGFVRAGAELEPRMISKAGGGTALLMPAHDDEYYVAKYIGIYPRNAELGLPTASSLLMLASGRTGVPLAIMDGGLLTAYRTAATSAVVARHLAPRIPVTVGFIGAGLQARVHATALRAALRVDRVLVYDVDRARSEKFSELLRDAVNVGVEHDPDNLVRASDVVVSATTSRDPVFRGDALGGAGGSKLIISVGWVDASSREIDDETLRRSSAIIVDTRAALEEAAELREALGGGVIGRDKIVELSDLLKGKYSNKFSDNSPVLYKGVGTALEDLLAAEAVYRDLKDHVPVIAI